MCARPDAVAQTINQASNRDVKDEMHTRPLSPPATCTCARDAGVLAVVQVVRLPSSNLGSRDALAPQWAHVPQAVNWIAHV